jgi:hypothetical protein
MPDENENPHYGDRDGDHVHSTWGWQHEPQEDGRQSEPSSGRQSEPRSAGGGPNVVYMFVGGVCFVFLLFSCMWIGTFLETPNQQAVPNPGQPMPPNQGQLGQGNGNQEQPGREKDGKGAPKPIAPDPVRPDGKGQPDPIPPDPIPPDPVRLVVRSDQPLLAGVTAFVEVDGLRKAEWPNNAQQVTLSLSPGVHQVTLRTKFRGNYFKKEFSVTLKPGNEVKLSVGAVDPDPGARW